MVVGSWPQVEMESFKSAWDRFHPARVPLRIRLRDLDDENWVRFHSLPGSKRYAENDAERAIVLARANALAKRVLGGSEPIWLVQTRPHFAEEPTWWARSTEACAEFNLELDFRFWDDETDWDVCAVLTSWADGRFDRLIMSIANDESHHTLWMSAKSGAIFSPYDGGMDLFLPTPNEANLLKDEFRAWLSPRVDGY